MYNKTIVIGITMFLCLTFFSPLSYSHTIKNKINSNKFNNPTTNIEIEIFELEPGDIAFKHPDAFPERFPTIIDHCLLYIGYNKSTDKYVFIEASIMGSRVRYRWEDKENLTGKMWGPFGRVKTANSTQKQNAIDFAKIQVGRQFQGEWINKNYNPDDTDNDSLANEWYCSEIIWAAYYNCNNAFPEKEPKGG